MPFAMRDVTCFSQRLAALVPTVLGGRSGGAVPIEARSMSSRASSARQTRQLTNELRLVTAIEQLPPHAGGRPSSDAVKPSPAHALSLAPPTAARSRVSACEILRSRVPASHATPF